MLEIYTVLKKKSGQKLSMRNCCNWLLLDHSPGISAKWPESSSPNWAGKHQHSPTHHPFTACGISFSQQAKFWIVRTMTVRDKGNAHRFPVVFHSICSFTHNPLLIESIYCKSRCSSSLRRKLFLLKLVLGMPSGKKVKQHPVCFLFGSYESSWRKVTREACKKSPSHCTSSQMFIKIQWEQPWDSVLALLHGSPTAGLRPRTAKAAQPRTAQVTVQQDSHICERSASDEGDNKKQHPRASIPGSPGHWQHRVLCREARMWWSCLKNTPQAQLC